MNRIAFYLGPVRHVLFFIVSPIFCFADVLLAPVLRNKIAKLTTLFTSISPKTQIAKMQKTCKPLRISFDDAEVWKQAMQRFFVGLDLPELYAFPPSSFEKRLFFGPKKPQKSHQRNELTAPLLLLRFLLQRRSLQCRLGYGLQEAVLHHLVDSPYGQRTNSRY